MRLDACLHFGIKGLGGGDINQPVPHFFGQSLCDDAFSRSGAARDQYRLAHGVMKKQKQAANERGITTVQTNGATQLYLIRHAPVIADGLVYGRRDLPADCGNAARFASLRASLPDMDLVLSSPAKRCLQTAQMVWPKVKPRVEDALWEQSFGDWEGIPFADIPDHGQLDGAELAAFTPPNGESFDDVCARTAAIMGTLPAGRVAVVAHAGVIRAALSQALGGVPSALRFEIANLSLTSILILPERQYVVREVNRCC